MSEKVYVLNVYNTMTVSAGSAQPIWVGKKHPI